MPFFYDPNFLYHLLFMLPGMLFAVWAQFRVKSTFNKWSQVAARRAMTGADAAAAVLKGANISDVEIEEVPGTLTDHYDPREKKLRLSSANYRGRSVAAFGVAAHEAGHAIQHATGYGPLRFRSAFVPMATLGSNLSWILLMIGSFMSVSGGGSPVGRMILLAGILLFSLMVIFTLVTVPVEIDASRRAMQSLNQLNLLNGEEGDGARDVLRAAAWTYVAAAATAVLELLYYVIIFMNSSRGDRDQSS